MLYSGVGNRRQNRNAKYSTDLKHDTQTVSLYLL